MTAMSGSKVVWPTSLTVITGAESIEAANRLKSLPHAVRHHAKGLNNKDRLLDWGT